MNQKLQTEQSKSTIDLSSAYISRTSSLTFSQEKISTRIPRDMQKKVEKSGHSRYGIIGHFFSKQPDEETRELIANHSKAMMQWVKEGFADGVSAAISYGVYTGAVNKAFYICAGQNEVAPEKYIETMKVLIEKGDAKVNYGWDGDTPLINACKNNNIEIAKFLISAGANLNANYGKALNIAVKKNNIEMVKTLINAGAFVSTDDGKLFLDAIKDNNIEILKCLVLGRPTMDVSEKAFKYAVQSGNKECAKIIAQNMREISANKRKLFEEKFNEKLVKL